MVRAIIVDDDPNMRMVLEKAVAKIEGVSLLGSYENGNEAITIAEDETITLALLDVDMPVINGIETAKGILDIQPRCKIVFITAHQDYMAQAFELYAFDYITKPFKMERFIQTMTRIIETSEGEEITSSVDPEPISEEVLIKVKEGLVILNKEDILMVERVNRQTILVTRQKDYVVNKTLQEVEELLDEGFLRCHKSYIVRIEAIKELIVYGRWTYIVKLKGTEHDALMTKDKAKWLEEQAI